MPRKNSNNYEEGKAARNAAQRASHAVNGESDARKASKRAAGKRYYHAHKFSIREKIREKWKNDPEFRAKNLAQSKLWAKKNPERSKKYQDKYRIDNKDSAREYAKRYALNNPDKIKDYAIKYRADNREKLREKARLTYRENLPENRAKVSAKRADKRLHPQASKKSIKSIFSEAKRLAAQYGIVYQVDHIIPITAGGWHHEDNMQPLDKVTNGPSGKWYDPFWISKNPSILDWRDVPRALWPETLVPEYEALIAKNSGVSIRWDAAA